MSQPSSLRPRIHSRYPACYTVLVDVEGNRLFATLYEVSFGGAFVHLDFRLPCGTRITVIARGSQGQVFALPAYVRYSCDDASSPRETRGMGIAWGELSFEERAFVMRLVERAKQGKSLRTMS
ncbi:MAG: PilZ domain-containing protein [Deltaproteobacteria bacterium]|nr:PilZ domain-containing protein [Deltaproteobacteria bacterium]